ncbi:MAG: Na/Pi cotransporter family protein [Bacilli bacterium]|jgi:phosphate:Na+ symporter|nr:Na/Pi cotransporter family protein [Bacilli bacterium]
MNAFIEQAQAVHFNGLQALAGLAIFLFGIKAMGDNLKAIAGNRMKELIDRYTTNPVMGVFVGATVTGLIQSSSGTTALTISLVRSGLMNLRQAVGIIMGANIGTTVTAILIGFHLTQYSPYFLIVGAFMTMLAKKPRMEHYGMLLVGFGALFYGLMTMGDSLKVLAEMPIFKEQLAVTLSNNKFAGVGLGMLMTLVIQSSSATIGILQTLYSEGVINLQGALPILFGDNIGTTITAILASIGGSIAAKRAAAAHVCFNLIGTICFIIIFPLFYSYINWAGLTLGLNKMMQIAFAHASFNVATTVVLLPFVGALVALVTKLIRDKGDEDVIVSKIVLDKKIIAESPEVAVSVAYKATIEMSLVCEKIIRRTREYINTKDYKLIEKLQGYEDIVNDLNDRISNFLVEIGSYPLAEKDNILQNNLFYSLKDLERIGDQCQNVVKYFYTIYDAREELTPMALADLMKIFDLLDGIMINTTKLLRSPSHDIIIQMGIDEEKLDDLETSVKAGYIERVKNKEPMGATAISVFVDIVSDLERIGDHCYNISSRTKKVLS